MNLGKLPLKCMTDHISDTDTNETIFLTRPEQVSKSESIENLKIISSATGANIPEPIQSERVYISSDGSESTSLYSVRAVINVYVTAIAITSNRPSGAGFLNTSFALI